MEGQMMDMPEEPSWLSMVIGWAVAWGAPLAIWLFRGGRKYEQTSAKLDNHETRIKTLEEEAITQESHDLMQKSCQVNIGATVDNKLHVMQNSLHREISDVRDIACKILGKIEGMNK